MKQQWQALAAKFNALAKRERAMVALAVIFVIGMPGYTYVVEPERVKGITLSKRIDKLTNDLAGIEAQLLVTQKQMKDPDAANRAALQQARMDLAAMDVKFRSFESRLVPPDKMQFVLESLLSRNRSLELLELRTLPPTSLLERAANAKAPAPAAPNPKAESAIYKHGIEIRIAGSYNDLLRYLADIEQMPQRIIWNRLNLVTEQYPRNVLSLTVYTLSLDKQWLVV